MTVRPATEAEAIAYAARHNVRLATARAALGVPSPQGAGLPTRPDIDAVVTSTLDVYFRSTGAKPKVDAGARLGLARSAAAAPAASSAHPSAQNTGAPLASDPKTDAARAYAAEHGLTVWQAFKKLNAGPSAQKTAAESAVALFKQTNGVKHG